MRDKIDKNLEFKTFTFVALLGAWLWVLKNFVLYINNSSGNTLKLLLEYVFIFGLAISFVIFYSLINLGIMLMYSSIYQIEENREKVSTLETLYKARAKNFFGWWPVALISIPGIALVVIIGEKIDWYYTLTVFLLYQASATYYFFKKMYSFKDLLNHFKPFGLWLFCYIIVFVLVVYLLSIFEMVA